MKKIKKLAVVALCGILLSGTAPFCSDIIYASDGPTITTFADIIDWRYTIIDGYFYRRLYNYSKEKWVGEWEKCV